MGEQRVIASGLLAPDEYNTLVDEAVRRLTAGAKERGPFLSITITVLTAGMDYETIHLNYGEEPIVGPIMVQAVKALAKSQQRVLDLLERRLIQSIELQKRSS